MKIVLDVLGDRVIERQLLRFADRAEDARPAFDKIADDIFLQGERRQFDSQGGYGSGGWKPLAPVTVAAKAAQGLDPRIGHATLRLRRSATERGAPDQLLEVLPSSLAVGTTVPYAKPFNKSRKIFEPPDGDRRSAVRILQRFLVTGEA